MSRSRRASALLIAVSLIAAACTAEQPTLGPSSSPTGSTTDPSASPPSAGTPAPSMGGPTGSAAATSPPVSASPGTPGPVSPSPSVGRPTATPDPSPTPFPTERPSSPPTQPVKVGLEKVADGFDQPNGVFHARDDRLFVAEQKGRINVLARQGDRFGPSSVFLDITRLVACCGERGILGLAFHPQYADNGLFYVTYSTNSHFFMLEERRVSDDPDAADPDYRREVLRVYKPHDYHWGGGIHFGPDGYLWLAMGDGGFLRDVDGIGDPDNDAQALDSLFGKVLRFDPLDPDGEGRKDYTVPTDNPYVGYEDARPEIWAVGLRNPWRWSFDSLTGDLWLTDTGHATWEEVNRARYPDLGKGRNYGWRLKEGPDCYIPEDGCDPDDITSPPLGVYQHVDAGNGFQCAITGGQVYRGSRYPALTSRFLFGDYCSGQLFSLDADGKDRQRPRVVLETAHLISSLGSDASGELYITEYGEGAVYRVTGEPRTGG